MHVFRSAHERGDSRTGQASFDGDREISQRSRERREGTDEETLRRHLSADLGSLMNTVCLEASIDLSGLDHVRRSVVNYGFADMSLMDESATAARQIAALIREALVRHEPRLLPGSIDIKVNTEHATTTRRIAFDVAAEMVSTPVDVPLDFVAEVDLGVGKIHMTRLRVQA
ncbi:MAG: type VI secretion system baseplate subunit TssE [Rubellimicrobium sp.]|nr:type VI secretion system baseplate subunit TssE [Rubellimicrobium sp.]